MPVCLYESEIESTNSRSNTASYPGETTAQAQERKRMNAFKMYCLIVTFYDQAASSFEYSYFAFMAFN